MRLHSFTSIVLKIALFIGVMALVFWLGNTVYESGTAQALVYRFGYVGVFILSFFSGFNVLLPLPVISFLPVFIAADLNTTTIILIISIGMTLGDTLGYLLGRFGRTSVADQKIPRFIVTFETWIKRHKVGFPLFLFIYAAFVPLANELVVIPAGAARQRWWLVLIPIGLGNIAMNILFALGISSIFSLVL